MRMIHEPHNGDRDAIDLLESVAPHWICAPFYQLRREILANAMAHLMAHTFSRNDAGRDSSIPEDGVYGA